MYKSIVSFMLLIFLGFSFDHFMVAKASVYTKEMLKKEIENYGEKATNKIPASYSKEDALKNGDILIIGRTTNHNERIQKFINNVKNKKPDFIRFVEFTSKGDPVITEYQYNGKLIYYRFDSSRDRTDRYRKGTFAMSKFVTGPKVLEDYCQKLVVNSNTSYLTNCYHFDKVEF
ncbi:DUF4362 domain-containing protein [Gottfriedia acidiceleris]|uniref:DUF4362 domain-containing protein n=1 Tax=Gottfriedia acidiceleris TaxID=371036 RepID=A0ABY4JSI0_9BACI|nr:DUF4362 domain-containing protein [Gottfriedia acidiceleris]UPM56304.1 DUF4362 domain-containing protein [Gottfriedia acidiceleris]